MTDTTVLGLWPRQWPPVLGFACCGLYALPEWRFTVVNAVVWYGIAYAARRWG